MHLLSTVYREARTGIHFGPYRMFTKLFLALVTTSCVVSNPVMHPRMQEVSTGKSMPIKVRFDASGVNNFAQHETGRAMHFRQKITKRQNANVPVLNEIVRVNIWSEEYSC